jgi:hypothetical protein
MARCQLEKVLASDNGNGNPQLRRDDGGSCLYAEGTIGIGGDIAAMISVQR